MYESINLFGGMGEIFVGIGVLFILIVASIWFNQMARTTKINADSEECYFAVERAFLKKFAEKNNIDMDKEIEINREIMSFRKKPIRHILEQKIRRELEKEMKEKLK